MNRALWKLQDVTLSGTAGPGSHARLQRVSLDVLPGVTAVIGYSGAGKTSLLNLLTGFEKPSAGEISASLPDEETDRLPLYWVSQEHGLWPHLTAAEHLQTVLPAGADSSRVTELLERFDLREKASSHPDRMSLGERARLAVARAIASEAAVLVMDEPLAHVDPARAGKYWQVIREYCHGGQPGSDTPRQPGTDTPRQPGTLVIATHDPETVLREAERVICLKEGRVHFTGAVNELYYRPETPALAEFLGAANWFSSEDSRGWLRNGTAGQGSASANGKPRCYRPEQIAIEPDEDNGLIVESSQFAGSVAEVELRDEATDSKRRFFHRPAGDTLRRGDRVSIRALALLLLCVLPAGCGAATGGQDGPQLAVGNVKHWVMPPDGYKVPSPRSMAVGEDGEFLVLDTGGRVLVFDATGHVRRKWHMPEYDVGKPEGICRFQDGRIAVADTHYHRVVFFNGDGELLSMLGSEGGAPGEFVFPVDVEQDEAENFYVCEYGGEHRVQKFTVDGKFLLEFGSHGTGDGEFQRPSGIVWHEGKLYVADAFNNRVVVYTDDGKFVGVLGGKNAVSLYYPYDIAKNAAGELFVVEYGAGRVTKLDLQGRLLGRFGSSGIGEREFFTPWGLALGENGRLCVADTGNRRIVAVQLHK